MSMRVFLRSAELQRIALLRSSFSSMPLTNITAMVSVFLSRLMKSTQVFQASSLTMLRMVTSIFLSAKDQWALD